MQWTSFNIEGKNYSLDHLSPFDIKANIDGEEVTLHVTFGHHCFTDEKENGPCLFKSDDRYWSQERYDLSLGLPKIIQESFLSSYAVPYKNRHSNEQYNYMEKYDYAIFFDISKPSNSTNYLKIKVISAYEVDLWGKGTIPKGKAKKVGWILSQRLKNIFIL